MPAVETCSESTPCKLCTFKNALSFPVPNPSPSRRGNKPRPQPMKLDRIEVRDKSDLVAVKRANNTMAARKSRQKQIDYLESLEEERQELRAECNHWKNWITSVEDQYGFIFPTWLAANTIPAKASPAQVAPTRVTAMQQASTQQLIMRALPSEAISEETTTEQTRRG